jgi:hypothetical protein
VLLLLLLLLRRRRRRRRRRCCCRRRRRRRCRRRRNRRCRYCCSGGVGGGCAVASNPPSKAQVALMFLPSRFLLQSIRPLRTYFHRLLQTHKGMNTDGVKTQPWFTPVPEAIAKLKSGAFEKIYEDWDASLTTAYMQWNIDHGAFEPAALQHSCFCVCCC